MLKKIFYYKIVLIFISFNAYAINLKFTEIVNLDYPWSLTFINDNELLISGLNLISVPVNPSLTSWI